MHQYIEVDGKRYRRAWGDAFGRWTHEVEVKDRPGCWRILDRNRCWKRIAQIDLAFRTQ